MGEISKAWSIVSGQSGITLTASGPIRGPSGPQAEAGALRRITVGGRCPMVWASRRFDDTAPAAVTAVSQPAELPVGRAGAEAMPGDEGSARSLLERAHAGDGEAFAALFAVHRVEIERLSHRLLDDHASAEDATAEVFLRARRGLSSFDITRKFRSGCARSRRTTASTSCEDDGRSAPCSARRICRATSSPMTLPERCCG